MYLPPVTPSSHNLIQQNDIVQKCDMYYPVNDNYDKEIFNYLTTKLPQTSQMLKQEYHNTNARYFDEETINYLTTQPSSSQNIQMIKTQQQQHQHVKRYNMNREIDYKIPKGNSDELRAIGNIGLHLSDFETEVFVFVFCILYCIYIIRLSATKQKNFCHYKSNTS